MVMKKDKKTGSTPLIKMADSKEEQRLYKKVQAYHSGLGIGEHDSDGNFIDESHMDMFFDGPLHMQVLEHQPNGPRFEDDPQGHFADYFFFERMNVDGILRDGYFAYFSTPGLVEGNMKEWGAVNEMRQGTRTVRNRLAYYFGGFIEESLLIFDGYHPAEFTHYLSL